MVQVRALDNRLKQIEDFQKSLKEFLSRNPIFESVTLAEKGASKGGIKLIASKDGVFLTALQGTPCAVIVASQKGSHTIRIDGDKARIEVRDADGKPSILSMVLQAMSLCPTATEHSHSSICGDEFLAKLNRW